MNEQDDGNLDIASGGQAHRLGIPRSGVEGMVCRRQVGALLPCATPEDSASPTRRADRDVQGKDEQAAASRDTSEQLPGVDDWASPAARSQIRHLGFPCAAPPWRRAHPPPNDGSMSGEFLRSRGRDPRDAVAPPPPPPSD